MHKLNVGLMADSAIINPSSLSPCSSADPVNQSEELEREGEMVLAAASMRRSGSRPQLDLSGAAIQGNFEERSPTILLPNQFDDISRMALDIGGSLIKLVYFSRHEESSTKDKKNGHLKKKQEAPNGSAWSYPTRGGQLHFVKFETRKLNECLEFIRCKQLHSSGEDLHSWKFGGLPDENAIIKATGGGAYKFAEVFKDTLGFTVEKEDEMDCLVAGANFLLKTIRYEAFTYMKGRKEFVQIDQNDLFPYLLVNIGSGVSVIKVDGDGSFQRVSGTNVGGGTFWGLGKLLTKCKSFDELLELSQRGNNTAVDMLVGDIYGGMDYSKIGLSSSTIASSFGKTISENKDLLDYKPEDIALSLLRMVSYNIAQIAYYNALLYGLKRVLFGGFFIRGHAFTMETISVGVHSWSKGQAQALFLRHEGYLGALGALLSYDKPDIEDLMTHTFVEQFPNDAQYVGGFQPQQGGIKEVGQKDNQIIPPIPLTMTGITRFEQPHSNSDMNAALNIGVLHLVTSREVAPLLEDH
ncbi:pantothenate kinase 2 isoform X2 [Amborella trichopoda]|uniref:pantothenate kinase 2 isoform X2 n=1 Tax=Amborella trichopoda TaxID=13333 RepID=UPI0005D3CA11|nr:pantothenate kinase 2 isoform X2 [Amborella trichopoda]|eukprot:XP_011622019.1 pantothenate kinase 2 isoform X2 [Amborella trichopoda]